MSNYFRKMVVRKKIRIVNYSYTLSKGQKQILGAGTVLKFLQSLALVFSYICLQFFPGNFRQQEEIFLTDKCIENFKRWL